MYFTNFCPTIQYGYKQIIITSSKVVDVVTLKWYMFLDFLKTLFLSKRDTNQKCICISKLNGKLITA